MTRRMFFVSLAALSAATAAFAAPPRPIGDSRFLASVPAPGYPEGIAIHGNRIYVSGPAAFNVPGAPSIWVYDKNTNALVETIEVQGFGSPVFGVSCIAFGDGEKLYVAAEGVGIVEVNVATRAQRLYAGGFQFVGGSQYQSGPAMLLNDLAFDKRGYLYVTDSFQAAIWRVPPGGGAPVLWYHSSLVDGVFGPNGVRVDAKSEKLYFDVTLVPGGFDQNGPINSTGAVYTLPLIDSPTDSDLQLFHAYPTESGGLYGSVGPDGVAFGKSGNLYVALAGSSQISVLSPSGQEIARFSGPAATSDPNQPLTWQNPANIAIDNSGKRLLVTNHASLVSNPVFAIFDVYVDDHEGKLW